MGSREKGFNSIRVSRSAHAPPMFQFTPAIASSPQGPYMPSSCLKVPWGRSLQCVSLCTFDKYRVRQGNILIHLTLACWSDCIYELVSHSLVAKINKDLNDLAVTLCKIRIPALDSMIHAESCSFGVSGWICLCKCPETFEKTEEAWLSLTA